MPLRIVITDFDPNKSPARTSKWHCVVMVLSVAVAALIACAAPLPPVVDQTEPPPQPEVVVSPPPSRLWKNQLPR